nr:amidase family protein [Mycolicibacterium houstonense]
MGADPGKLRIGLRVPTAINPTPHREAFAAVEATAAALTELGHHVEELPRAPFDDAALARDFLLTWFVYSAWELAEAKRLTGAGDDAFERDTLIMAAIGRATSSVDYLDAVQRRHEHTRRLSTYFESYDLLLTPTLATPPPRVGEFDLPVALQRAADVLIKTRTASMLRYTKIVDDMVDKNLGWVPYTQLAKHHRPPGDLAATALDGRRSAARGAIRGTTGRRVAAAQAGRPARAGDALGRSLRPGGGCAGGLAERWCSEAR